MCSGSCLDIVFVVYLVCENQKTRTCVRVCVGSLRLRVCAYKTRLRVVAGVLPQRLNLCAHFFNIVVHHVLCLDFFPSQPCECLFARGERAKHLVGGGVHEHGCHHSGV